MAHPLFVAKDALSTSAVVTNPSGRFGRHLLLETATRLAAGRPTAWVADNERMSVPELLRALDTEATPS